MPLPLVDTTRASVYSRSQRYRLIPGPGVGQRPTSLADARIVYRRFTLASVGANMLATRSRGARGMITIFTSAFAQAARSRAPGQVSVSNFAPTWWHGPEYSPLVPSWTYRRVPQNPYEDVYAAQLALLNATTVIEDLTRLVGGDVVTLLCHCQPDKRPHVVPSLVRLELAST